MSHSFSFTKSQLARISAWAATFVSVKDIVEACDCLRKRSNIDEFINL